VRNQTERYVLLDRDGVINRRVVGGYVTAWEQFEFLPRVLDALRLLAEHGYAALVISNQASVGKKLLKVSELEAITRRFQLEVALAGGNIKQVYYCVHLPSEHCECRKPQPGLIHRAQLDYTFDPATTYFVGDSPSDLEAATRAGCPGILLRRDAFLESPILQQAIPLVASNLYEAATMIVARQQLEQSWPEAAMQAASGGGSSHVH